MARPGYREDLESLERRALLTLGSTGDLLGQAMRAVDERDVGRAGRVIERHSELHAQTSQLHGELLCFIARQTPVAADLRLVVALMQVCQHVERIGDQCVKVARLARTLSECPDIDGELMGCLREMTELARGEIVKAGDAFALRDVELSRSVRADDTAINERNRRCFRMAVELGRDTELREGLAQIALTARAVERIGDNAVDVAEQAAFVVTGELREFSDASHAAVA